MTTAKHPSWRVRVALVSGNCLARVGLQGILQSTPGIQLICESSGGALQKMKPDCVIIDLESEMNLLESVRSYRQLSPQTRVLLFVGWNDMERARAAMGVGAAGIVLKCQPPSLLLAMIEGKEKSPASTLASSEAQPPSDNKSMEQHVQNGPFNQTQRVDCLTRRERTVIALVGEGLSNRDISDRLSISDITVRHHLTRIFDKLDVSSRQKLLIFANQCGLVELTAPVQISQEHSSFTVTSRQDSRQG